MRRDTTGQSYLEEKKKLQYVNLLLRTQAFLPRLSL